MNALETEAAPSAKSARANGEILLSCRALEVGYGKRALLPPIDLQIRRAELWAVIGRNGSGKTSYLRTLLGLLPPVRGEVREERRELKRSYLAQRQSFDELYPLLVRDLVAMGLVRGMSLIGSVRGKTLARVEAALDLVGARELIDKPFRQLSEGQKQRVLFARVAVAEPDVAVLDEPTSAMDVVAEREAFELIQRLRNEVGIAIVLVSHYLGLAREYADRALLLDRAPAEVVVGTPREVLAHEVFRRRYSSAPDAIL